MDKPTYDDVNGDVSKFLILMHEYVEHIEAGCMETRRLLQEGIDLMKEANAIIEAADAIIGPATEILPDTYDKEIKIYYDLKGK